MTAGYCNFLSSTSSSSFFWLVVLECWYWLVLSLAKSIHYLLQHNKPDKPVCVCVCSICKCISRLRICEKREKQPGTVFNPVEWVKTKEGKIVIGNELISCNFPNKLPISNFWRRMRSCIAVIRHFRTVSVSRFWGGQAKRVHIRFCNTRKAEVDLEGKKSTTTTTTTAPTNT